MITVPKLEVPNISEVKEKKKEVKRHPKQVELYSKAKEIGLPVYSYSRLNTINNCAYEYYLTYIKKQKGVNNIYGVLGGISHEVLEDYTRGNIKKEEMLDKFLDSYNRAKLTGAEFPSEKVEKRYIGNLKVFFSEYEIPKTKIITEEFLWGTFSNNIIIQGFADEIHCHIDDEGNPSVVISDHKSSSKFKKEDLLKYGRQLVLYSVLYNRLTGIPVREVQWNMMKYSEVRRETWRDSFKALTVGNIKKFLVDECGVSKESFTGMKKADLCELAFEYKDKIRTSLGIDFSPKVTVYEKLDVPSKLKKYLTNLKVDSNIIEKFERDCLFNELPSDVIQKLKDIGITVGQYIEKYTITEELKNEMENFLIDSVNKVNQCTANGENGFQPMDIKKKGDFFCANLCGHSENCKYFKAFKKIKLGIM